MTTTFYFDRSLNRKYAKIAAPKMEICKGCIVNVFPRNTRPLSGIPSLSHHKIPKTIKNRQKKIFMHKNSFAMTLFVFPISLSGFLGFSGNLLGHFLGFYIFV
jgi:hypothetical protein